MFKKKSISYIFLLVVFTMQGSAFYRSWQPVALCARSICTRVGDQISRIRTYMPHWTTCNKNMQMRPWANRVVNISRVSWAKPAVITVLAGAGLGTYCLTRSPVLAQEDRSFVQPEVRAFLQEAQKITITLQNELQDCNDYTCANVIFNKCENLIGILLHNEYEGVSLQGAHQASVKCLLQDILEVKKVAVAKALHFAQDNIWSMWHTADSKLYYNKSLIDNMLSHIGSYSGMSFRHNIHPQESDWVKIPLVYERIIASVARNAEIKQEVLNYLHKRASAINQQYTEQVANPLLDILYAVERLLNV